MTPIQTPNIFAPVSTPAFAIRELSFFVFGVTAVRRGDGTRICRTPRSEEHTSELQSRLHLVCRLLLEKKKKQKLLPSPPDYHAQHRHTQTLPQARHSV